MMISPENFVDMYKDKPYKKLLKVRDELIRDIHHFEKYGNELPEGVERSPSPETEYYFNQLYLVELLKLIIKKYKEQEDK